jgi:hypothetical protein
VSKVIKFGLVDVSDLSGGGGRVSKGSRSHESRNALPRLDLHQGLSAGFPRCQGAVEGQGALGPGRLALYLFGFLPSETIVF